MKDLKNTLDQVIKAGAQDIAASRGNVTRHTLVDLQKWADALPVYAADVAGAEELDYKQIIKNLFSECAMIHKYGGSACNSKQADEAINAARAAIQ